MDKQERETVERMCKVAFWCVQQQPEARPPMSAVVRMLEGEVDIDAPPVNPFQHLVASPAAALRWTSTTDSAESDNTLRSGSRQSAEVIIPIGSLQLIATIIFVVAFAALLVKVYRGAESCGAAVAAEMKATAHYAVVPDAAMRSATVERFLWEMAHEKPIRFTPRQLAGFTRGYSARLGAGGFGTVYGGALPNGLAVAVKVLRGGMDRRRSEEQFMAEVGTIGRTHHINLVRLFGFCFDAAVRALVYEYMGNGALDAYLFDRSRDVGVPARRAIAVGVARGLRYLHEDEMELRELSACVERAHLPRRAGGGGRDLPVMAGKKQGS
uniref:Protein kinase domain-containing protein n=1 Tax=Oryza glumipatula TaxID=40148 RepID=A0A0E0AJY6_9ORYZ